MSATATPASGAELLTAIIQPDASEGRQPAVLDFDSATATRANRALISHGKNGLLVQDSPEALAAGMIELCQRDDLRQEFQSAGRESIREHDWNRIVESVLLPTYESLVES